MKRNLERVPLSRAHPQPPLLAPDRLDSIIQRRKPCSPLSLPMGGKRSISHQGGPCLTHSKSKCLSHLGKFCYLVCWESHELLFPQQSSFHFPLSRLQLRATLTISTQTKLGVSWSQRFAPSPSSYLGISVVPGTEVAEKEEGLGIEPC